MGQKVHPFGFRLGVLRTAKSKYFADKDMPKFLEQDERIRKMAKAKLVDGGISRIDIERSAGSIKITLNTSKPGVVIGRGGQTIEELKAQIRQKVFGSEKMKVNITIQEVSKPDMDAQIVMQNMVEQLEKRLPFRRVMKRTLDQVMRAGAKGAKLQVAGRLNGAEIARTELLSQGKIPLHTMRADIDYSRGVARTIYGAIGIKVWIYKGEVFDIKPQEPKQEAK